MCGLLGGCGLFPDCWVPIYCSLMSQLVELDPFRVLLYANTCANLTEEREEVRALFPSVVKVDFADAADRSTTQSFGSSQMDLRDDISRALASRRRYNIKSTSVLINTE